MWYELKEASQRRIPSLKLSLENIKHGPFTFLWSIVFDFHCIIVRKGHTHNKYHNSKKNGACDKKYYSAMLELSTDCEFVKQKFDESNITWTFYLNDCDVSKRLILLFQNEL